MFKPTTLFIAFRYLKKEKTDNASSFLTVASFVGITLSSATIIIVLSLVNGFEKEFKDRILSLVAHLQIYPQQDNLTAADENQLMETVSNMSGVSGIAPFVYAQGMISSEGNSQPVYIKGVHPQMDMHTADLSRHLVQGILPEAEAPGIVITQRLAEDLNLNLNHDITLLLINSSSSSSSTSANARMRPQLRLETIVGIIDTHTDTDKYQIYGGLFHITKLAEKSQPDGYELFLNNVHDVQSIANDLFIILGADYYYVPWTVTHITLFEVIKITKAIFSILLLLIIVVAGFIITSNLVMLVRSKGKDIAILKTLGLSDRNTTVVFIYIGTLLSIMGLICGTLLGIMISPNLDGFVKCLEATFHLNIFNGNEYPIDFLPSEVRLADIIYISVATIIISILACYYPAKRAASITPVDAFKLYD